MVVNLKRFIFILTALLVVGCDSFSGTSVRSICSEMPELCQDLNMDLECKAEKEQVIIRRKALLDRTTDYRTYKLLLAEEKYLPCIKNAADMAATQQLTALERTRLKGYISVLKERHQLEQDTKMSEHPHLLYYHWSRKRDGTAGTKFLALKDTSKLNFPELQFGLAAHFIKSDRNEATRALYKAIQYTKNGIESVNPEIYQTLASIFFEEGELDKAYIWAYISAQTKKYYQGQMLNKIDVKEVVKITREKGLNITSLKATADSYLDAIEAGEFRPPV